MDLKKELKSLQIAKLKEFPGNPQEQTEPTFFNLKKEIEEEGFDQPLIVIKDSTDGNYLVVSGNHRLKALRDIGATDVPCIIKDWDLTTAKLKMVQRNKMTGEINPLKLQELVDEIHLEAQMPLPEIANAMAFDDYAEFADIMALNQQQQAESYKKAVDASNSERSHKTLVDSIYTIVQDLLEDYGENIDKSFIYFLLHGRRQMIIDMDDNLKDSMKRLNEHCGDNNININEVLSKLIENGLESLEEDYEDPLEFEDEDDVNEVEVDDV